MKNKLISTILAASVTMIFIGSIQAFDIGGAVQKTAEKTAKGATRGAVTKEYNEKLKKQDCTYPNATSLEPNCDVNKIISELNAFHSAMESSGMAGDVDVLVYTHGPDWDVARQRADKLRDKVSAQVGYWDYYVEYRKSEENQAYFQVRTN
jgi:hypothetical protein